MITLYGIKNCDTVKKACKWLELHGVEYQFHDFRVDGLEREAVQAWLAELGWQNLVNKRSTSWKALDAAAESAAAIATLPAAMASVSACSFRASNCSMSCRPAS